MSGRKYIIEISNEAADRYDKLVDEGMAEREADVAIILEEYGKLQMELVKFKKTIGLSVLKNIDELKLARNYGIIR